MLSVPTIAIMEVIIHSQMDSPQSTITTMHNFNIIIATNRTCVYLCVSCLIISDVRSQTNFESTKSFSHSRAKVERIKFRVYLVIWLKWKSNSEHSTTAASPPPPPSHMLCVSTDLIRVKYRMIRELFHFATGIEKLILNMFMLMYGTNVCMNVFFGPLLGDEAGQSGRWTVWICMWLRTPCSACCLHSAQNIGLHKMRTKENRKLAICKL